jgi:hypothetical protein
MDRFNPESLRHNDYDLNGLCKDTNVKGKDTKGYGEDSDVFDENTYVNNEVSIDYDDDEKWF